MAKNEPWWSKATGMEPPLIANIKGPTWGPSGADKTQVGPMLAPWTLLSGSLQQKYRFDIKSVPHKGRFAHYSGVRVFWCPKSPATRQFVEQLTQTNNKETSKCTTCQGDFPSHYMTVALWLRLLYKEVGGLGGNTITGAKTVRCIRQ